MYEDQNTPRPSLSERIVRSLHLILASVFGTLRYSPPTWLPKCFEKFKPVSNALSQFYKKATERARLERRENPKVFWAKATAMSLGLVVIIAGAIWFNNRPQPYLIDLTGNAPAATPLVDNAKPDPLSLNFSDSAARLDLVGKVVTKGIGISPLIQGEWIFTSDRHLKFTPSQDWAVNEKYVVTFETSIFAPHAKLRDYRYRFNSAGFTYDFREAQFYQDPTVAADKKVTATLRFSHSVNPKDFEKRIRLELQEKDAQGKDGRKREVPFSVSYDKYKGEAYLLTERITLPASDSPLTITIAKGVRAERGGDPVTESKTRLVTVPGMLSFFKISAVNPTLVRNEKYEPEQVLVVETTAPLTEDALNKNISAYILPPDRPAEPGNKESKNHYWSDPAEVSPGILKLGESLKLDPIPTENETSKLHSYRFNAPVGRYVYVKIAKGTQAFGDYVLSKDFDRIFHVPEFPAELNVMSEGSLLSLSGKKKVSLISRGVGSIRMEVGRVIGNQVNHLISQAEGNYSHPVFQNYRFNEDDIVERFYETRNLASQDPQKAQYTAFDFTPYLTKGLPAGRRGLFLFSVHKWDAENQRTEAPVDQRLILVTDLGVIAKHAADGSFDVFVQSIATGSPIGGATVEVLGKNGLPILSQSTSNEGKAHIPNLKDFTREKAPIAFVVRQGGDFSFLPYDRYDRRLNYSRFEVGGIYANSTDGLSAYLFSDRGIYRPGEAAEVGIIIRANDWKPTADLPLLALVTDPRGLEVFQKKLSVGKEGLETIHFPTDEGALTGQYQVSVYIIKDRNERSLIGSTNIRIEEFEPDKLRISARLSESKNEGWISPGDLKANVSLQTLFGFAAANRKVHGEIDLLPMPPVFKKFSDFHFFDPAKTDKSFSESLGDLTTNEAGLVEFALNLERFEKATYRLRFFAEGFETEGGRGVATESYALISPLKHLVGYRADGELKYVTKGSERHVELLAIDSSLKPTALGKLKAQLVEYKYVSSLLKQPNGTFKYQSVRKETIKNSQSLEIAGSPTKILLTTDTPGDFAVVIRDESETILNRIEYSVSGSANLARNLEKTSLLQLRLSKVDYAPGEEVEVQLVAPFSGSGLITIERDKVYAHHWFKSSTTASVQKIRVPQNLEGNAYLNVTFVRGLHSPEIYTSPLSYAVAPFSIAKDRRKHKIELQTADKVLPGDTLKMRYRVAQNAKIVLFAVDEGILQVARYENPDPLSFFFQKRALQVTTSQIVDMILPEFDLIEQASASGGGEGSLVGKNLNPFRRRKDPAVVYWSGILSATGGQWGEVSYPIPDSFNGALRVIAVAVSPEKMGVAVGSTTVRGPFVVSPTVPFFVAPHDEFQIAASIANDVEGSGKDAEVSITLQTGPELEVVGPAKSTVKISEKTEGVVRYTLKAKERLGSANLKFLVEHKNAKVTRGADLSIRPPTHYQTVVHAGSINKGGATDITIERKMYPHLRNASVMVGHLPLGYADGLLSYLRTYPYGCTEQQVSRAFPALVLKNFPEFGNSPEKVQEILQQVLGVLQSRQNDEGGFGFWAANSHADPFQAVYATHFLTEAKELGYSVPESLINRSLGYLAQIPQGEMITLPQQRLAAYATYLLLRNGNLASRSLTNLYQSLQAQKDKSWRSDLTAIYLAGSYAIIQDKAKSWELIKDIKVGTKAPEDYEHFYDNLVRDSQYLYVLAKHFPERLKELSGDSIQKAFSPIGEGTYNTINSSYSILALAALAGSIPESPALKATVTEILGGGKARPLSLAATRFPKAEYSVDASQLKIQNGADRALFYSVTEGGFDRLPPGKEIASGIEVTREYRDLKGTSLTQTKLGEEIEVRLAVRALKTPVWHAALVDLMPGGFEVVRDSIRKSPAAPSLESSSQGGNAEEEDVRPMEESLPVETDDGAMWLPELKGLFSIPEAKAESENDWQPNYVDIREDRVVLYGYIPTDAKIYSYRIKSTNEGKFVVPAIYVEGMYDRKVKAHSKGGTTLEVKAR